MAAEKCEGALRWMQEESVVGGRCLYDPEIGVLVTPADGDESHVCIWGIGTRQLLGAEMLGADDGWEGIRRCLEIADPDMELGPTGEVAQAMADFGADSWVRLDERNAARVLTPYVNVAREDMTLAAYRPRHRGDLLQWYDARESFLMGIAQERPPAAGDATHLIGVGDLAIGESELRTVLPTPEQRGLWARTRDALASGRPQALDEVVAHLHDDGWLRDGLAAGAPEVRHARDEEGRQAATPHSPIAPTPHDVMAAAANKGVCPKADPKQRMARDPRHPGVA